MNNIRFVTFLTSFIVGVAPIVFFYVLADVDSFESFEQFITNFFLSFVWFFAAMYGALFFDFELIRKSIEKKIGQGFIVEQKGIPKVANSEVVRDILAAQNVWNTFVGTMEQNVSDVYRRWLENPENGVWEDLVGMPEFFSSRFEQLHVNSDEGGDHRVFVLKEFSQIVNFVVLEFADKQRDNVVYFGWIGNDKLGKSQIFRSSDRDVVAMFRQQFESLKRISWNYTPELRDFFEEGFLMNHKYPISNKTKGLPSSLVNKSGNWETLSYSFSTSGALTLNSYAFIAVSFDLDRVVVVARIFSPLGIELDSFTTFGDATFKLNNIFFHYKFTNTAKMGLCHYQFSRHATGDRVLSGSFFDSRFESRSVVCGRAASIGNLSKQVHSSEIVDRIRHLESWLDENDPNGELRQTPSLQIKEH